MPEIVNNEAPYTVGSGNVFADLGRPDAQEAQIKGELVRAISHILASKNLTQAKAAELLGVDQAQVSNLLRGRLSGFSTERLLRFLGALGRDVKIVILEPQPEAPVPGRVSVVSRRGASPNASRKRTKD